MTHTQQTTLRIERLGTDRYDSVSANGWFVMSGETAVAGPFVDAAVAQRRLNEEQKYGSK